MENLKTKNLKIFFLLVVVVFLSGCSVKYELNINKSLTINEKLIVSESYNTLIDQSVLDKKNTIYVDPIVSAYVKEIEKNNIDKYGIQTDYQSGTINTFYDNVTIKEDIKNNIYNKIYTENLNMFSTYKDKIFVKNLFDTFEISVDNNIVTINISGINNDVKAKVDDYTIVINVPYDIIENNATTITKSNGKNICTWKYENDETFSIKLKFYTNKLNFTEEEIDDLTNPSNQNLNEQINKNIIYIVIGIVIIILTAAAILIMKSKKNSQI